MKTLLLIISGLIITSFTYSQNLKILENDELIRKHFKKYDIKSLNKILNFFDQIVKQDCEDTTGIDDCYKNYCEQVKKRAESGNIDLKFTYKIQKKMQTDMDKRTFDKIWFYTESYRMVKGKKVYTFPETIEMLYKSPYMNLIEDISNENPNLRFYYENYQAAGTLNSTMIESVFINHEQFNFSEIRERLMIAVHYLTVNSRFYDK